MSQLIVRNVEQEIVGALKRRAARHGKLLGINGAFLYRVMDAVVAVMRGPENMSINCAAMASGNLASSVADQSELRTVPQPKFK